MTISLPVYEEEIVAATTHSDVESWDLADNGDGTLRWVYVDPASVGFSLNNQNHARYNLYAKYKGIGLRIHGNAEKHLIDLRIRACDQAILEEETGEGSPDSNRYSLFGQRARRIFTTGNDCSSHLDLNFEAPIDLGLNITLADGTVVPDPRILVSNGKIFKISGENRTHNGRLFLLADRLSSTVYGSDTLISDGFTMTDNSYGTAFWFRRVQKLMGAWTVRKAHNGRQHFLDTVGNIPLPTVRLDKVKSGCFSFIVADSGADTGLHIGDATKLLFPEKITSEGNLVTMRDPVGKKAVVIEKAAKSHFGFVGLDGDIHIGAGCQYVTLKVPGAWVEDFDYVADPAAKFRVIDFAGNELINQGM